MRPKLGELLIKEKMITPEQLEVALKIHRTDKVKLGSCLITLGYVSEEALAQLLSEKLGVPRVGHRHVLNASWKAVSKIPRELAIKYRVIPFQLDGNRLSVAMSEPDDFRAIEEIGFITGCVVIPYITPDVVISQSLEKFHQIYADAGRYYGVARHGTEMKDQVAATPQSVTFEMKSENGEFMNVTVPAEFEGFGGVEHDPATWEPHDLPSDGDLHSSRGKEGTVRDRNDLSAVQRKEFIAMFNILARKGLITREEMVEELKKLTFIYSR